LSHTQIRTNSFEKNIAANQTAPEACPRVDAFNLAAAPESGHQQLRLNPENHADNRLYQGTYQGKIENWDVLPVEGRPVDDVLAELEIEEVNFVKIDIQGYEQKAISGFQKTLARSQERLSDERVLAERVERSRRQRDRIPADAGQPGLSHFTNSRKDPAGWWYHWKTGIG
jgi:FkbM family methyltransferase